MDVHTDMKHLRWTSHQFLTCFSVTPSGETAPIFEKFYASK
uniref:Uncharacterized protein n=1 Tax=Nelumbo nucifera TaxID=4432 RepID=A0A822ZVN0_NELNU|nr:TPA_asm: hypothetical protein HUJ06_017332 [Nelumbo nucifera]